MLPLECCLVHGSHRGNEVPVCDCSCHQYSAQNDLLLASHPLIHLGNASLILCWCSPPWSITQLNIGKYVSLKLHVYHYINRSVAWMYFNWRIVNWPFLNLQEQAIMKCNTMLGWRYHAKGVYYHFYNDNTTYYNSLCGISTVLKCFFFLSYYTCERKKMLQIWYIKYLIKYQTDFKTYVYKLVTYAHI